MPSLAAWALLAVLLPASVPAQTVQRIEIVGATPLPGVGVPKDRIPGNVQTAGAAELEASHALDLAGFMARQLGSVHVNELQNNPFQPDVSYRGFTASPLLGTPQGLSVYLDGVRLNQPFGDVVSWDLIPRSAIASMALMPGSNPLFGLNTLGGALSVQTKDGQKNPGTTVQALAGLRGRLGLEFEVGGSTPEGLHGYATGNRFRERGWRDVSFSDVSQLFAKVGAPWGEGRLALSVALADNTLAGGGLQEARLLARDRASVYTRPDITHNQSLMLNASATQRMAGATFTGNAYYRTIRTTTFNGDANADALDQSVVQPSAADIAALQGAGYSGFPTSGATAANTPFPFWRCMAQALIAKTNPAQGEPVEKCNGLLNSTRTVQSNFGISGQWRWELDRAGQAHTLVAGGALDFSRVHFTQGSQLGYLSADHGITPVDAFVDGSEVSDDGTPYDNRVDLSARSRTVSLYASDTVALDARTHLTVSGRYDHHAIANRDALTPGGGSGSLDTDQTFGRFNPALGLTLAATPAWTLYAGLNQGSRAPSAVELGCADPASPCKLPNAFAGDPPLRPVVTTTAELGVRGRGEDGMTWNLGLFRSDSRDDLLFVAGQQSGFGYFRNFGATRRQGLEAGFSAKVGRVMLAGNYTWLDATYRSHEVINGAGNSSNDAAAAGLPGQDGSIAIAPGDPIPFMPRHMLKLRAQVTLAAGWSIDADLASTAGAPARGNENGQHQPDGLTYLGPGRSGGYTVLNLGTEWRVSTRTILYAQVNNLLDRSYATAAQLGATAFDAEGRYVARALPRAANGAYPVPRSTFYAPGAPRMLWVGVRLGFGG